GYVVPSGQRIHGSWRLFPKNASLPVMLLMSKVTQGELRTILNMQNNIRNERQKHQYLYQSTDILINLAGMRD
ncbi:TPA: hypothetical protein ACV199_003419, partial [Escherichia coli]